MKIVAPCKTASDDGGTNWLSLTDSHEPGDSAVIAAQGVVGVWA